MAIRPRPMAGDVPRKAVGGNYESHMTPIPGAADHEADAGGAMVVELEHDPVGGAVENGGNLLVDLGAGTVNAQGMGQQQGAFQPQGGEVYDHYENVALRLEQHDLKTIGQRIHESVLADQESRKEWEKVLAAGTKMLISGELEDPDNLAAPIKVVQHVKHPIFAIAVYQYQTRAYKQLLPPQGPVKGLMVGERTNESAQRARRVEDFMNYQLVDEDGTYGEQTDQLLLVQAIDGSVFRKWYHDPLKERNVGRYVRAIDVIVPYGAEGMDSAIRITHRYRESSADVHRKMLDPTSGYRQVALGQPSVAGESSAGTGPVSEVQIATDEVQGITPAGIRLNDESDEYTFFEQQVYLDLSEHVDDRGVPTGIPLPYVVTIETESQEVMAIWRDWDEEDEQQRRLQHFAHYKFLPGPGFYGLGYAHLLCGIAAGVTAALRILLVGAMFASASGGFVTKDAGGKMASAVTLEPGKFKAIDSTFDELEKAFFSPDFKEPSAALPNGIEMLLKSAERLSSTVEAMVGDAPTTGPVGTTLALIEQSGELYSGIHQRNHRAMKDELRMQFRLNGIHVPEEGYPYYRGDQDRDIYAKDFANDIQVVPVSDPNIFSSQQRIALAQAQLEIAERHPDLIDKKVAIQRLFDALRVPEPDELFRKQSKPVPMDPISENAMVLYGIPVVAALEQDHDAHLTVHQPMMLDKNLPPQAQSAMSAHMADHMAKRIQAQAAAAGIPIANINTSGEGEPVQPVEPRLERAVSIRAAQYVQKQQQAQNPEAAAAAGEQQARMAEVRGNLKIRAMEVRGKLQLEAQQAAGKMRIAHMAEQHRQRLGHAQSRFDQKMAAHKATLENSASTEEARAGSKGEVDTAQAELTAAVESMVQAVESLAAQMKQATDDILAELDGDENNNNTGGDRGEAKV